MVPILVSDPLTTAQKVSVCPVEEVRAQARITSHEENDLLALYIATAYDFLSGPDGWLGGVSLLEEEWETYLPSSISDYFELPMRPLLGGAITSFEWLQADGSYIAVTDNRYNLWETYGFSRIQRTYGISWPYYGNPHNRAYRVRFSAGYAPVDEPHRVPHPLRQAIRMLAADLFNNREASAEKPREEVIYGLVKLAGRYRVSPDHS